MNDTISPAKPAPRFDALILAGIFVFLYAFALALAPAVRIHADAFNLELSYLLPFAGWLAGMLLLRLVLKKRLPAADPWLLPIMGMLTGWGLLTVWRLSPALGQKQLVWYLVGCLVIVSGLYMRDLIAALKRYSTVWLVAGILLVTLTFFFGVHPSGSGPKLWLNLFGVYLQPSEPLKLLMIVYLAAFFADQIRPNISLMASILPTVVITALIAVLLVFQQDLGTAALFVCIYIFMLVLTTRRRRFLWIFPLVALAAGVAGYFLFDVVRVRVDTWLNPWLQPAGASYQLVQAQIAIAAGKIFGTGPGLGNPGFIPVAVSDFIFSAIAEESGLLGTSALLLLYLFLVMRGVHIALTTKTTFGRYLAFGISIYFTIQTFFIVGGNLSLVPLTGITLPFLSYGGSSLLTSMTSILLLLLLSAEKSRQPFPAYSRRPYQYLASVLILLFIPLFAKNFIISVVNQEELVSKPENLRWAVYDQYSPRGDILTLSDTELAITTGTPGKYERLVLYPPLSNVIGYTSGLFGQTGLEQSLYPYLRGYGKPFSTYWQHELLYNQPPPGSDVRVNLNLNLQIAADELLGDQKGAIVLMNAQTGEIYALASHPSFDANTLEEQWESLMASPDAPLLNRTTQAAYPVGTLMNLLELSALWSEQTSLSTEPELPFHLDRECYRAIQAGASTLDTLRYGCESAAITLRSSLTDLQLVGIVRAFGLFSAPSLALEVAPAAEDPIAAGTLDAWFQAPEKTTVSPLQMALVAATLTNDGYQPAPKLANSYQDENGNWIAFGQSTTQQQILDSAVAFRIRERLKAEKQAIWYQVGHANIADDEPLTWYIGGTTPEWTGTPLAIAIAIEGSQPALALQIGSALLNPAAP